MVQFGARFNTPAGQCVQLKRRGPSQLAACKALGIPSFCARAGVKLCIVGLPPSDLTTHKMILTRCAVCATDLGLPPRNVAAAAHATAAPCQVQHWKEGGNDTLCKK